MALITVLGTNPFAGQKDPYVGMSSNMDFDDDGQEIITNTYTLDGVLSGCSYSDLAEKRDALARDFDWKANPLITGGIVIDGLDQSGPDHGLVPRSVSFASSNYVGALPYTIQIDSTTGYDYGDTGVNEDQLINKTHTVSLSINEKGCSTTTTNISCTPNGDYTGDCGALTAANEWITKQLGVVQLGASDLSAKSDLINESLTINPLTSEISYTSTAGVDCDNTNDANAPNATGEANIAHCTESTTENPQCTAANQVIKVKHNGEIYDPDKTEAQLLSDLSTKFLNSYDGIANLNGSYSSQNNSITFTFETHLDGNGGILNLPKDLLLNTYGYTISTSYGMEDDQKDIVNGSINGNIIIENRIKKPKSEILNYDTSSAKDILKGKVGGDCRLTSENTTKDEQAGTHSYSYAYSQTPNNPDETPSLDDYSGVTNYSIAYTPALNQYETVPNLNCDDLIFDKKFNSDGNVTITLSAVSGSGYSFENEGDALFADLKNQVIKNQGDLDVTKDSIKRSDDAKSATWTYAASFTADSAIDENEITSMY